MLLVSFEDAIPLFKLPKTVYWADRNTINQRPPMAGPLQTNINTQRERTSIIQRGSNPPFHTSCPVRFMRYAAGYRNNDARLSGRQIGS
jgi:hypothetical protein